MILGGWHEIKTTICTLPMYIKKQKKTLKSREPPHSDRTLFQSWRNLNGPAKWPDEFHPGEKNNPARKSQVQNYASGDPRTWVQNPRSLSEFIILQFSIVPRLKILEIIPRCKYQSPPGHLTGMYLIYKQTAFNLFPTPLALFWNIDNSNMLTFS